MTGVCPVDIAVKVGLRIDICFAAIGILYPASQMKMIIRDIPGISRLADIAYYLPLINLVTWSERHPCEG